MEKPIHEVCQAHPFKCREIDELKQTVKNRTADHEKIWDHIGMRPKTKTVLIICGIVIGLFSSMFGLSISLNQHAVSEAKAQSKTNQERIEQNQKDITELMGAIRLTLKELETNVKNQQKVMDKIAVELEKNNAHRR